MKSKHDCFHGSSGAPHFMCFWRCAKTRRRCWCKDYFSSQWTFLKWKISTASLCPRVHSNSMEDMLSSLTLSFIHITREIKITLYFRFFIWQSHKKHLITAWYAHGIPYRIISEPVKLWKLSNLNLKKTWFCNIR